MMKSSKSLISARRELGARAPEGFGGAVLGDVLEPQGPLVGQRRLQADRPRRLGLLKQPVKHDQIVVERFDLEPFCRGEVVRIVALRFELGG